MRKEKEEIEMVKKGLVEDIREVFNRYSTAEEVSNALEGLGLVRVYSWGGEEIWTDKAGDLVLWLSWLVDGGCVYEFREKGSIL